MIKSVDISGSFKPKHYFTLVLSSDFITFEDCIKQCAVLTKYSDYGGTISAFLKILPMFWDEYILIESGEDQRYDDI